MESPRDLARLLALIGSVATRASADSDRLAASMAGHCWPGGVGDRSELIALAWLSRWRPVRLQTPSYDCGCLHGYCAICN